jgi:hypothetical protein
MGECPYLTKQNDVTDTLTICSLDALKDRELRRSVLATYIKSLDVNKELVFRRPIGPGLTEWTQDTSQLPNNVP